jgi:hypothetical protein
MPGGRHDPLTGSFRRTYLVPSTFLAAPVWRHQHPRFRDVHSFRAQKQSLSDLAQQLHFLWQLSLR